MALGFDAVARPRSIGSSKVARPKVVESGRKLLFIFSKGKSVILLYMVKGKT